MEYFLILHKDKLKETNFESSNNNLIQQNQIFKEKKGKKNLQIFFLIIIFFFLESNNDSKQYYQFNKFVNKETVKLINLNFTKKQYKKKGLEFLNKIKKNEINNITKQFKLFNTI